MPRRVLAMVVFLASILLTSSTASAQTPAGDNLIFNPSFEGGMYHTSMSNFIADGWSYWYESRGPDDPRGWWLPEPEYGLIANRPGQARSGAKSQRWFNTWAIHNAGVYQTVKVPENSWLRYSIWMFNWSSQEDKFGVSDALHRKWVGIDPTGGTDPFSSNIVWGNEDKTMDTWVQLGVIAQARGDKVTVFVRERPEYSVKHNDVLLDDAELVVIPTPMQPVMQPVVVGPKRVGEENRTPEGAVALGLVPTLASIPGSPTFSYGYFTVEYPGGNVPYTINVQATPNDARILGRFEFRVYGPSSTKPVLESGYVHGGRPNVVGDLIAGEKGRYLVQVVNENPLEGIDYRIWVSAPGMVAEAPSTVGGGS